jgi:hypothetical protein
VCAQDEAKQALKQAGSRCVRGPHLPVRHAHAFNSPTPTPPTLASISTRPRTRPRPIPTHALSPLSIIFNIDPLADRTTAVCVSVVSSFELLNFIESRAKAQRALDLSWTVNKKSRGAFVKECT